jgi:predicted patatin/cPLA2 family phospholipase
MTFDINNIDTLCSSGGGNKCFTVLGALDYFVKEHNFDINKIKTFCGTSGGAIMCYSFVLGYTLEEVVQFLIDLNFYKLINSTINLDKLIDNYGLDIGDKVIFILKELLMNKYNVDDITFQELYNLTNEEFIVIGTNYTRGIEKTFSYKTTPNVSVITALRISVSIPIVFTPVLFEDEYYVDGGISNNFPINYCNPDTTLGLLIKGCIKNELNNIFDLCFNSFNIMFDISADKNIKNYNNIIHIVNTPEMIEKGFSNFDLDEDYKKYLLDLGYKCSKYIYEN